MSKNLAQFFREDYEPLALRGRSDNTRRLYRTTLANFARYLERPPLVTDLTDDTLTRFFSWFRALPRAPESVNKEHANLTAIWRFANRRGVLKTWPTVGRDIEPHREPQAWMESELRLLFDACQREDGFICKIPARLWWKALLLVLWDSGERVGGVMGLRWQDVDLKTGWCLVRAETRKGKLSDRVYELSAETVEALKAIKKSPGLCFPWDRCKTYLWDRLGIIAARAGLPNDRKSKFHRIRRTVASYYEAAGGNATELLGHTSRKITLKGYIDKRIVKQAQPKDKLFRLG